MSQPKEQIVQEVKDIINRLENALWALENETNPTELLNRVGDKVLPRDLRMALSERAIKLHEDSKRVEVELG
jgi:hypothetical protein